MADIEPSVMRHVIAALVTNEPGVLAQVAGMFAARGFNIDSLVVGRTENPELSRMTIVVHGDDRILEQIRKQLQRLVPVVKVVSYQDVAFVERDLMLVQVASSQGGSRNQTTSRRTEIIELVNLFRARVVDVSRDGLMIELSGTEEKIEAFIAMVEPYGVIELARTGVIAMPRGSGGGGGASAMQTRRRKPAAEKRKPNVDPKKLPPG
jgi:acetolactate synthase-1/3 small subunit